MSNSMSNLYSLAVGVGTKNSRDEWLEVFYPTPLLYPEAALEDIFRVSFGMDFGEIEPSSEQLAALESALRHNGHTDLAANIAMLAESNRPVVAVMLAQDSAPASVPEGYLKLHLLSHRLVKPHGTDLTGIFGALKNIAWTSAGAIDIDELPERLLKARMAGQPLSVDCVDKFPKMVDYVVPTGIRIADTSRVRLGAYVGEGTTVMHEGFINFNAGAEGPNMIEGRVSAGVFCGAGSDIGGGASIMGTLSGGGSMVISMGEKCLLGANAGLGISLGDRCTVEAGLYITSGTVVTLLDDQKQATGKVKARELSGKSDLLFRRNSVSGAVECLTNKTAVELNEALHSSN
jgi:2,3,4,5-tetrahydropyridine-2,6-dicarboxylate N-succinyltransferase